MSDLKHTYSNIFFSLVGLTVGGVMVGLLIFALIHKPIFGVSLFQEDYPNLPQILGAILLMLVLAAAGLIGGLYAWGAILKRRYKRHEVEAALKHYSSDLGGKGYSRRMLDFTFGREPGIRLQPKARKPKRSAR